MIRTIEVAVKFLERFIPTSFEKHPGSLGLERMGYLVKLLGNPQDSFKSIHVGGTSGKGSTSTIIASILVTKYKIGLHTSPHLAKINERIKINGSDISDKEFVKLINEIKPAVDEMKKSELGAPSYFEIVTAMAFMYFKKQKVDYGVIEVGMGGRFDATNVIKPQVAVLTNVGLDHTEILGDTVEKIAKDKSGIIKSGVKVVTGIKQSSVKKIIKIINDKKQITNNFLREDFEYKINKITDEGSYFDYFGNNIYKNLFIPLLGEHQAENAALAIRAIEEIYDLRFKIYEEDIRRGLKKAHIEGRLEIVRRNPLVILDGAHNPDKMRALVKSIKTIWPNRKVITILAIKEGKNSEEMVRMILPISKKIILTNFVSLMDQGKILSIEPEKIEKIIKKKGFKGKVDIIYNPEPAVGETIKKAQKEDIILVTGSLYLVGIIRKYAKHSR